MSLNISGGALEFDAVVNFDTAMDGIAKFTTEFQKAIASQPEKNQALDMLKEKFAELQGMAESFKEKISETKDPEAVKELTQNLTATNTQLKVVSTLINNLSPEPVKGITDEFVHQNDVSGRLYAQLRAIKQELATMAENGQKDTPLFTTKLEEATHLEHALKNVHQELDLASSNVAGLEALGEGFKGLLGGAEAFAGVMGLISGNAEDAEVITKNLVAIMSVLNGVEEVGAVISKNSALNVYLLQQYRKLAAASSVAQAVGTEAVNAAETEGIAVTEAATVAQVELNTAMELNPVGILIAGIVALYLAYEGLATTIFKASDAKVREKAADDALQESLQKSADTIGEEQAELSKLIITAQSEQLTREQRQRAINELTEKYPEYLSNLHLENIYSKEAGEAIAKQTELIKSRAVAQAAEKVYAEQLGKVIEAQNELNKFTKDGAGFFEKLWASAKTGGSIPGEMAVLLEKEGELKDATDKANGAFDTMVQTQTNMARAMQSGTDVIQLQIDKLEQLAKAGINTGFNENLIRGLKEQQKLLEGVQTKAFDPATFEEEKKLALASAQYKVDVAKKGTLEELQARRELADKTKEFAEHAPGLVFDAFGNLDPEKTGNKEKIAAFTEAMGKYKADVEDLNKQISEKGFQNATAAAQAIVLALQAAGKAGSDAYFLAQAAALRKSAAQEIFQAQDNAGEILRIREQLALNLHNLDIERQKQELANQKSVLQVQLDNVKIGSDKELELRKQLIDNAAQAEILSAGQNAGKVAEIQANAEKAKRDLTKKFTIEAAETETNIAIAGLNTRLAAIKEGTDAELELKKQLVDQKAALDVENAQKDITNEQLLAAKITEIHAKALTDKRKLDNDYYTNILQLSLKAIDNATSNQNAPLEQVSKDPFSSVNQKSSANLQILLNNAADIQAKMLRVKLDIDQGRGNVTTLEAQYSELEAKLKQAGIDIDIFKSQAKADQIKNLVSDLNAAATGLSNIAQQVSILNPKLGDLLSQMSTLGGVASNLVSGITAFESGDIAGTIQAGANVVNSIVKVFADAKQSAVDAKKAVQDFYDSIVDGELKTAEAARQAALQRSIQSAKNLQGLKDEYNLIISQKKQNQDEYNKLLQQVQQESFVSGEHTEKGKGSLLFGLVGYFTGIGGKTTTVQDLASLAGKSFDQLLDLYNKGQLTDKAKKLFEQLKTLADEGVNLDDSLKGLQDSLSQTFTGTTSDNIANAIKDGLAQGKRSVADFADDFNSLMSNAILSAFEANQIQPAIADFYKKFAELSQASGGALSADQITQLRNLYNSDINQFVSQIQQLQQISGGALGGTLGAANSLTGAIKGMTEQTAELLAGQFGGLRITAIEQLTISKQGLSLFESIQSNTANMVSRMDTLLSKFDSYESGYKSIKIK